MGSSRRFIKWLGMKQYRFDAPPIQQVTMGLKLFNRQLERQVKRMEAQELNARNKAKERDQRGDPSGKRRLIQSALQYRKWLDYLEQFRFDLDDMNFQLTTAQDMNNFDQVGSALLTLLCNFKLRMGMPEIQRMIADLDLGYGNMLPVFNDFIHREELDKEIVPLRVSEEDVAKELGEKVKSQPEEEIPEISDLESNLKDLPNVPHSSGKSDDNEIFDLEEEIRRLRNKRNK